MNLSFHSKNKREYRIQAIPLNVPNNLRVVFDHPFFIKGALIGIPIAKMHTGLEKASIEDLKSAEYFKGQFVEGYNQK